MTANTNTALRANTSVAALSMLKFQASQHATPVNYSASAMGLQDGARAQVLAQATLLNWLGQAPISFHRIYVDITGNVVAGLWLSHALARAAQAQQSEFDGDDYVFQMSARDCEVVTGITRGQQVNCRKVLADLGLLSEDGGKRKTPTYRLHMAEVAIRMARESAGLADVLSPQSSTPATLSQANR